MDVPTVKHGHRNFAAAVGNDVEATAAASCYGFIFVVKLDYSNIILGKTRVGNLSQARWASPINPKLKSG